MSPGVLLMFSFSLAVACRVSRTARFYVKYTFFFISSIFFATVFVPLMFFSPKNPKNALLPAWGCRISAKLLGLSFEVRGHENIVPEGQGCVVLMNHQSALDLIVLAHLWPIMPKSCVISKKELFWAWPFGLATWLWGTVFIDRLNPEKAQGTINKTGEHINSKQARILMFPEGTRHGGENLLPFKKGGFHVALAAQCPVQPVAISRYHFLDTANSKFDSGHNIIEILPAIPTKNLSKDHLPELIETSRKTMQAVYKRLSAETLRNKKNS